MLRNSLQDIAITVGFSNYSRNICEQVSSILLFQEWYSKLSDHIGTPDAKGLKHKGGSITSLI